LGEGKKNEWGHRHSLHLKPLKKKKLETSINKKSSEKKKKHKKGENLKLTKNESKADLEEGVESRLKRLRAKDGNPGHKTCMEARTKKKEIRDVG